MITRGIIEQILSRYQFRIRIPSIDRTVQSSTRTNTENLNTAVVCTLPGCDPNIQVGDIVFISYDPTADEDAVILGYLYRSKMTSTQCNLILADLEVTQATRLSPNTSIGELTPYEINQLKGIKGNIQQQLDLLQDQISNLLKINK